MIHLNLEIFKQITFHQLGVFYQRGDGTGGRSILLSFGGWPGTCWGLVRVSSFNPNKFGRADYYPHFTDEQTVAQRGDLPLSRRCGNRACGVPRVLWDMGMCSLPFARLFLRLWGFTMRRFLFPSNNSLLVKELLLLWPRE